MNVKLLRKVQKHILAEPRRFVMGAVQSRGLADKRIKLEPFLGEAWNGGNKYERRQTYPGCGTAACIFGWAQIISGRVDPNLGANLSSVNDWPENFRSRYAKAKTPLTRARIASQRIDHFIKTKGRE